MAHRKPVYGWLVVGASAVLLALGLGMYNSTNSVFVKPICDALGFARGEFTLHRTIITLVGALLMPVCGGLIQRIGVRRVLLFSTVLLGAVTLGYSFAQKLWHFYALTGNLLIAVLCLGYPVCALLARLHWMPWVYAVFVGLASCGVSVPVAILIGRYFGGRDFPAIFSFSSMISSLASSASVPAMGAIYDATGSYRLAWRLLLILSAGISACLIGAELAHRARGKGLP